MPTQDIYNLYQNASLAQAAYAAGLRAGMSAAELAAVLSSAPAGDPDGKPLMSVAQAEQFSRRYEVLDQLEDSDSGFSATVFRDRNTGQVYFSNRGTVPTDVLDLIADLDLATVLSHSAAANQIISMVNYVKRLQAGGGMPVVQIGWEETVVGHTHDDVPIIEYRLADVGEAVGISLIDANGGVVPFENVVVNGHSLGGHLSSAYGRLFDTQHIYTFNGAGFLDSADAFFRQIESVLDLPTGSVPSLAEQSNVYAYAGTEVTANDFYFEQFGDRTPIFIEKELGFANHNMSKLVDSLGVMSAFNSVDSTLTLETLNSILEASAIRSNQSLETALNALGEILVSDWQEVAFEDSNKLYGGIGEILEAADVGDLPGPLQVRYAIQSLVGNDKTVMASSAQAAGPAAGVSMAYRYALWQLNCFVLFATDSAGQADQGGTEDLYADDANSLRLYNAVTGEGVLTEKWIETRAEMLESLMRANIKDDPSGFLAGRAAVQYDDYITNDSIRLIPDPRQIPDGAVFVTRYVKFGADASPINLGADILTGGDQDDSLFGGSGSDILDGKAGSDYLEGGIDNDYYLIGADETGPKGDTILDIGGQGQINWTGADGVMVTPTGGKLINSTQGQNGLEIFQSDDKRFDYILKPNPDGTKTLTIISGSDRVTVLNFHPGDLGITLTGSPDNSATTVIGTGSRDDLILRTTDEGVVYVQIADGGIQGVPEEADFKLYPDGVTLIEGLGGNDVLTVNYIKDAPDVVIDGGAGDDVIGADHQGAHEYYAENAAPPSGDALNHGAFILGGDGNDKINGSLRNDFVDGGTGHDNIYGGYGEDDLFADTGNDFLSGREGDDFLFGDADNDHLLGGANDDSIVGGDGNDIMFGDAVHFGFDWDGAAQDYAFIPYFFAPSRYAMFYEAPASLAGSDWMNGGDGEDILRAGMGNDGLEGGEDNDFLYGEAGDDSLSGGAGSDVLWGDQDPEIVQGDADTIYTRQNGDGTTSTVHRFEYSAGSDAQGDDVLDGGDDADNLMGGGGDDLLFGGEGNDYLLGGDDDDILDGEAGNDLLKGEAGNDIYAFGPGSDIDLIQDTEGADDSIFVSASYSSSRLQLTDLGGSLLIGLLDENGQIPDMVLVVDGGIESIFFEDGTILTQEDINELTGGPDSNDGAGPEDYEDAANHIGTEGDDLLVGAEAMEDVMVGAAGDDELQGGDLADALYGGLGADLIFGDAGADLLFGNEGLDELQGGLDSDHLSGGLGADLLFGQDGNDFLYGDGGDDELQGGQGDDLYTYANGDGSDVIFEETDTLGDRIRFKDALPSDVILARRGGTLVFLLSEDGTQQIGVSGWFNNHDLGEASFADGTTWDAAYLQSQSINTFIGTQGDDSVGSGIYDADDTLYGFGGNDYMAAGDGDNRLIGGAGDDTLRGNPGTNTFVVNRGDGNDTILAAGFGTSILSFGDGITATDLTYERRGNDLRISWAGTGAGSTTIRDWYLDEQLNQITFVDGSTGPTIAQVSTLGEQAESNYEIGRGGGAIRVEVWGGNDTVSFGAGITPEDVVFTRNGVDLVATINGGTPGDSVVVTNWFESAAQQVAAFSFAGSTALVTSAQLNAQLLNPVGTAGNDVLKSGLGYVETLTGAGGNDELYGRGSGDTLIGGTGNDTLIGDGNATRYVFNPGDGQDFINDSGSTVDTLTLGWTYAQTTVTFNGSTLTMTFQGGTDSIGIANQTSFGQIENILFTVTGSNNNDTLTGALDFGDVMYGLGGDDILRGGDNASAVRYMSDYLYGGDGNDSLFGEGGYDYYYGGAGNDTLGDAFNSVDYLNSGNSYDGGAGNDLLRGTAKDDLYWFRPGNGNDTLVELPYESDPGALRSSSADVLRFDPSFTPENINVRRSGNDLILETDAGNSLLIQGWFLSSHNQVEKFYFEVNGQVVQQWTAADVTRLSLIQRGTAGDDTLNGDGQFGDALYGMGGNDTLNGNGGADLLDGGNGNDALKGGNGSDTYVFGAGYGRDVISGESDDSLSLADMVQFTSDLSASDIGYSREGNSLVLTILATGDQLVIQDALATPNTKIESFVFADGSQLPTLQHMKDSLVNINGTTGDDVLNGSAGFDYLRGLAGNDTLTALGDQDTLEGGDGNDTLNGGTGNDALMGGAGNDRYVYAPGDGFDTVTDAEGINTFDFSSGNTNTMTARVDWQGSAGRLTFEMPSGAVGIVDGFDRTSEQQLIASGDAQISFLDWLAQRQAAGFVLQHNGTNSNDQMVGSEGADSMLGQEGNNSISGNGGNDSLYGGSGVDILSGGSGVDTLYGNGGADQLTGGAGNDILNGGAGDDTYFFGLGSGQDSIIEDSSGGTSTIRLDSSLSLADVQITKNGKDLVVLVPNSGDSITFKNWNSKGNTLPVAVAFNDGSSLSVAQVSSQAIKLGTSGADTIRGGTGSERIYALGGNDTVLAKAGDDLIYGGVGDDRLEGGVGADTYMFAQGWGKDTVSEVGNRDSATDTALFGNGISLNDLIFSQSGSNLVISTSDGVNTITVDSWFSSVDNQIEVFKDNVGNVLLNSQIEQLVQASAQFEAKSSTSSTSLAQPVDSTLGHEWLAVSQLRAIQMNVGQGMIA